MMASSYCQSDQDQADKAACQDTFPEVEFFEVPADLCSKNTSNRHKDLVKHPSFRHISAINGQINRMVHKHLKVELEKLSLDSRGTKDVLRKRLKAHERQRVLQEADIEDPNTPRQYYTHLVVIDFEATCEEQQTKDYVHEIIEFPAVLVNVEEAKVVAEFHSLVRPELHPELSDFCRDLTGIEQSAVDAASPFPAVLEQFGSWLHTQGVSASHGAKLAVATDGPWDMARFLLMQCSVSRIAFPSWARSWINLRKVFSNFYVTKRLCLSEMLTTLGLEFQGRPHCGLDDARNIAAIAEVLIRDGASPRVNETIAHLPRSAPPTVKGSSVACVALREFETSERRRHRASERNERHAAAVDTLCDAVSQGLSADEGQGRCAAAGQGQHSTDGQGQHSSGQSTYSAEGQSLHHTVGYSLSPADPLLTEHNSVDYVGVQEPTQSTPAAVLPACDVTTASTTVYHKQNGTHAASVVDTNLTAPVTNDVAVNSEPLVSSPNCGCDSSPNPERRPCNSPNDADTLSSNSEIIRKDCTDDYSCSNSQYIVNNIQSNNCNVDCSVKNVNGDYSPSDNDYSTSQDISVSTAQLINSSPYVNIDRSNGSAVLRVPTAAYREPQVTENGNKRSSTNRRKNHNNNRQAERRDAGSPHQTTSNRYSNRARRGGRGGGGGGATAMTNGQPSMGDSLAIISAPLAVDLSDINEFPSLGSKKKCHR